MNPNYTIIRCQTTDKIFVMDLLCDADEYELIRDHVDVVYYNGDDDLEKEYTIDSRSFLSMGKATPFDGWKVRGEVVMTLKDGKAVYNNLTK